MHPINNKNFGIGKVRVYYYNGSALTRGYVVKQIGIRRYVVSDGSATQVVHLTGNEAVAKMLTGEATLDAAQIANRATMTLTVGGNTRYVTKLTAATAITTNGTYSWTLGAPSATVYAITAHSTPVNTVAPAITGTAKVGQVLTASNGTWANAPTSYTYQWNAAGSAISGATSSTYTPVVGDVGKTITVTVTAVKSGTTPAPVTSAATAAVAA